MAKSLKTLIGGERQAVKDYGERMKAASGERKVISHIRGEERQHERELKRVARREGRR